MSIRVLIADDEELFTEALSKVLRHRGMHVEVRSSADGAVAAMRTGEFDVVLLDVKMPGKSGIECLAEIRGIAPSVPVILLTGHLAVEDERDGLSAGAFAYLLKPHPLPDLVARIKAAVNHARESPCSPGRA